MACKVHIPRKSESTNSSMMEEYNEECHFALDYPFMRYKKNMQNNETETLMGTMHSDNNVHRYGESNRKSSKTTH